MKELRIDLTKPLAQEPHKGHNRWHPDIPPAIEVEQGEEVLVETRDAFDGQLTPGSIHADVARADGNLVHPMTGPVFVKGARPGDLLEVSILDIEPDRWGYTCIVPNFGFLRDLFPDPFLVKWHIHGREYADSPDLPGVRIPGAPFMGLMGVAPSRQLLRQIHKREEELRQRGGAVNPPEPKGAVPTREPIASEGLRTTPPRENGGNMDIKQLTAGARLLLPVFVDGALFSVGDAHFAQGDAECCGVAIEMAAKVLLRFRVLKGEAERRRVRFPIYERDDYFAPPQLAAPRRFLATTGMPIRDGVNESEDATLAARNALLAMIEQLTQRGWSREQAYVICSVAGDFRVSQVVDVPNFIVSALLPLDIFGT